MRRRRIPHALATCLTVWCIAGCSSADEQPGATDATTDGGIGQDAPNDAIVETTVVDSTMPDMGVVTDEGTLQDTRVAADEGTLQDTGVRADDGALQDGTTDGDGGAEVDASAGDGAIADTVVTDTGPEVPPSNAPKLAFVHAAGGIPTSIKMCIHESLTGWNALIDTALPEMPTTGVPFGAGVRFPFPSSIAPALPQLGITLYLVPNTFDWAGKTKCSEIIPIGSPASTPPPAPPGIEKLNTLPAGSFALGKSYVVALTGCPAGSGNNAAGKAKCGPAYDDTANLKATVIPLDDTTAPSATTMGAQFIHLSPFLQVMAPAGIFASFGTPAGVVDIAGPVVFTDPPMIHPATAKLFTGLFTSRSDTRFFLYAATAGGLKGPALVPNGISLAKIELSTTGTGAQFLDDDRSFTFIAIGDPTKSEPPAGTDPTYFRVIALPND